MSTNKVRIRVADLKDGQHFWFGSNSRISYIARKGGVRTMELEEDNTLIEGQTVGLVCESSMDGTRKFVPSSGEVFVEVKE